MVPVLRVTDRFFDIGASLQDFFYAQHAGNREQVFDAGIRHVNAHAYLYYVTLSLLQYASLTYSALARKTPGLCASLHSFKLILGTTTLGFITYSITTAQESLAVGRHIALYRLFHSQTYKKNPSCLASDLEKLHQTYHDSELAARLRPWFIQKHQIHKSHLQRLSHEIRRGDPNAFKAGAALVEKIQALALKKIVAHTLGILSMVIATTGGALTLVACPLLIPTVIMTAGMGAWIVRILLYQGWIDNPNRGFSPTLCLPGRALV